MGSFDNTWEEIHANAEWGKYPTEHVIRFIARNYYKYPDRKNIKILDYGCGGGAHTWYLAREGFDTYAFDGSPSAINKAAALLERDCLSANLKVMDGATLTYDNDYFDAIIDNVCIYANTIENIRSMYTECYRVLKPSGKLITVAFSTETTGYGSGIEIEKNTYKDISHGRLEGRGTTHFFEEEELKHILSNIGFKNIQIDYINYTDCGDLVAMFVVTCEK